MLSLVRLNQFKRDYKRLSKRGKPMEKLIEIIELLAMREKLPMKNHDHALSNNFANRRECHIDPDWLLIYRKTNDKIYLERTGTHADLF